MSHRLSARQTLRLATAAHHERVDRAFGSFDLSDRAQYKRFLLAQADAHIAVETRIEESGAEDVMPDWPQRRRSALLLQDLAALGMEWIERREELELSAPGALLGAIYVLEGSRLGGSLVARSVPDAFPRRFLTQADSKRWQHLIQVLDTLLVTDEKRDAAIATARRVFTFFEAAALRHMKAR